MSPEGAFAILLMLSMMKGGDDMQIMVYSETTEATVAGNLGRAEYSYYFILEKYLPLLQKMGKVVFVDNPESDVDRLYFKALESNDRSVFLSFTPPNRTARNLRCPTICVLAWEFDSIPYESWDPAEPWDNWVESIKQVGNVVTISDYATRVVKNQVGRHARVVTIAAPVVSEGQTAWQAASPPVMQQSISSPLDAGRRSLSVTAAVIDTEALEIDTENVTPKMVNPDVLDGQQALWDDHAVDWVFSSKSKSTGQYLVGFYNVEEWGCWSKTAHPSIILPWSICGDFVLTLELVGYGENQGGVIDVAVGSETVQVVLQENLHVHEMSFSLTQPANSIRISGFTAISAPGARDHRTLGIGLSRLGLHRPQGAGVTGPVLGQSASDDIAPENTITLSFAGPVYTSVFNPVDGRKNWHDIVTAFCWAFRDDPDKTLVLKMSHYNRSTFLGDLLLLFSRLWPFRCRIVSIHGYLPVEQMDDLVQSTDFVVNASLAEGQCLPLLEFMAAGVPALAPDHTAMETYINGANAFVVASSKQPYIWPNDPRRALRTVSNRIDWDSLRQAYVDSATVLEEDPARYAAMSRAAVTVVHQHYSVEKIAKDLENFLTITARPKRWLSRLLG